MLLIDRDYKKELTGDGLFRGVLPEKRQIQGASVDLRLGPTIARFRGTNLARAEEYDMRMREGSPLHEPAQVVGADGFLLQGLHGVLVTTIETVHFPSHVVGYIKGKSSFARAGISVCSDAGWIEPGFEGQLTLDLFNHGGVAVRLYPGMAFCQLVCELLPTAPDECYRMRSGGSYQGQRGPTPPRRL